MAITLKDIAEKTGKSVTTVSRALHDFDDVSPETKVFVRRVADELGYIPNITARQLQKQRTDTIGLILPSENPRTSDPFFSELLSGIVGESTQNGVGLLVSIHPPTDNETELYLEYIRSRRVDGFIVIRTQRQDPRIDLLMKYSFPFVSFGRVNGNNTFPLIDEDGQLGIQEAVSHLVGLGHTRLAFIAEPTHFTKAYHRLQGFCQALEEHGLAINQNLIIEGGFRQRSGHLIGDQLLDMPNPPTAIVACNDLLALGAMRAIQERGLVVGKDTSVTGFDDIVLADYVNPPLTTCHQPARQIGKMIYQMLIKEINQETLDERQIILKPELIVRQSTGPVPK
jgi:LacI family transcriptional regulator